MGSRLVELTPDTLGDWIAVPDWVAPIPSVALRTDVYRLLLLIRHGGMWLDTDTILMQSLGWLYEEMGDADAALYAGRNALLVARAPGLKYYEDWLEDLRLRFTGDYDLKPSEIPEGAYLLDEKHNPIYVRRSGIRLTPDTRIVTLIASKLTRGWMGNADMAELRRMRLFAAIIDSALEI